MTNPYTPPDSELEGPQTSRRRPVLVWVICAFYGLASVPGLVLTPLMLTGVIPSPLEETDPLSHVRPALWIAAMVASCLTLVFVVQLFRLRAAAISFGAAAFAASTASGSLRLVLDALLSPPFDVGEMVLPGVGSVLFLAVLLYTWRLGAKGVLTKAEAG